MTSMTIRTRFAPSPTGKLHIGGARTALFNYLLAKNANGKFILRFEDTDKARYVDGSEQNIENDLKYLNIFPDESLSNPGSFGPYSQSQKINRYLEIAEQLIKEGKAYKCFCTEEDLKEAKEEALKKNTSNIYSKKCRNLTEEEIYKKIKEGIPYTIRVKTDKLKEYSWDDLIRGKITFSSNVLSDCVIFRSNNIPTYNFCVVVDDYDMKINHVLRGEEHIANTPYQLAIYHILGWEKEIPKFGHISMILGANKEKLSKRSGEEHCFVSFFKERGYPSEAIFNFLALLGWSHEEEEIFSSDQLIKYFNADSISKSSTIFDVEKLNWISHKYFVKMDDQYFLNFVKSFFDVDLAEENDKKSSFALMHKNRIFYAKELNQLAKNFFVEKKLNKEHVDFLSKNQELIKLAYDNFPQTKESWNSTTIRNYLKQISEISQEKGPKFFKPLRICFSYEMDGMPLPDLLLMLGYERTFKNLKESYLALFHDKK